MILDKQVEVRISNRNRKYYKDLGYDISLDVIIVDVLHLPKMSNFNINVSCDICSKTLSVQYFNYNKYIENGGIYTCHKCSSVAKSRITNLERYGVTSPLKNEKIKEKFKNTNIERYGFDCSLLSVVSKQKTKYTNIERYGVENSLSSDIVKNKRINTNIERYGVVNVFQSTCVKDKISLYKENLSISENLLNEWHVYKLEVRNFTRKIKKHLFETWDGYDYYDGEYIMENLKFHHNSKEYPTIDHVISIFHGFKNNISPIHIGSIDNLRITKRYINSSKNLKCHL